MSPEQTTREAVGPRTDLYSLGVMTFEMVAGRRPFEGLHAALVKAHLHETAPRLSTVVPPVPQELDDLVARLLAKSPDDRPQSASEVRAALAKVRVALGTPLIPLPNQMPWGRDDVTEAASELLKSIAQPRAPVFNSASPTASSQQRRSPLRWGVVLVALLAVLGGGGWGIYSWLMADVTEGGEDSAWGPSGNTLIIGRIDQLRVQVQSVPDVRRAAANEELEQLREQSLKAHSDQDRAEVKREVDAWAAKYLRRRE